MSPVITIPKSIAHLISPLTYFNLNQQPMYDLDNLIAAFLIWYDTYILEYIINGIIINGY